VVLQNAFNWSNYIGMTLLLDMADSDRRDLAGRRPARG